MQGPGNPGAFCYFWLLRCDVALDSRCRAVMWPIATSAPWMHMARLVLQTVRTAMRFAPANACEIWYIFLQIGYIYLRAGPHVSTMLPVRITSAGGGWPGEGRPNGTAQQ